MFRLGTFYTTKQIHDQVGGDLVTYLPHVGGRVVAARLRPDLNPDAPYVILPGSGKGIEYAAELLCGQRTAIPIFLKRAPKHWEYVGEFMVERSSSDPKEIAKHAKGLESDDITRVIHMTGIDLPSNGPQR